MEDSKNYTVDFDAIRDCGIEAALDVCDIKIFRNNRFICPAHEDHSPSAGIVGKSNGLRWHCFACGAGGDNVSLVAAANGVSRLDAAVILGKHLGVGLTERVPGAPKKEDKFPLLTKQELLFLGFSRSPFLPIRIKDERTGKTTVYEQTEAEKNEILDMLRCKVQEVYAEETAVVSLLIKIAPDLPESLKERVCERLDQRQNEIIEWAKNKLNYDILEDTEHEVHIPDPILLKESDIPQNKDALLWSLSDKVLLAIGLRRNPYCVTADKNGYVQLGRDDADNLIRLKAEAAIERIRRIGREMMKILGETDGVDYTTSLRETIRVLKTVKEAAWQSLRTNVIDADRDYNDAIALGTQQLFEGGVR